MGDDPLLFAARALDTRDSVDWVTIQKILGLEQLRVLDPTASMVDFNRQQDDNVDFGYLMGSMEDLKLSGSFN